MSENDTDQFSLRWNNFHSNLATGFHDLLEGNDLVDVTLAADGQFIQAHKIILSVCSPYFRELFKVNPCKHPIVILKDVNQKELMAILQFMYRGEVNVRQEDLTTFLKTAELLQIKGLTGEDLPAEPHCFPVEKVLEKPRPVRRIVTKPHKTLDPQRSLEKLQSSGEVLATSVESDVKSSTLFSAAAPAVEDARAHSFKRMRREVATSSPLPLATPAASSTPVAQQNTTPSRPSSTDNSEVEFMDITNPKTEPIDYESDIEEIDATINKSEEDPLVQLLDDGESRQSHHESQGAEGIDSAHLLMNLPGLSQDLSMPQDSGQGPLKFIKSCRGTQQLTHQGYVFGMNGQRGEHVYWRCTHFEKTGCRGRCITNKDKQVLKHNARHNHVTVLPSPRTEDSLLSVADNANGFFQYKFTAVAQSEYVKLRDFTPFRP